MKLKIYFFLLIIWSCSEPSAQSAQQQDIDKLLDLSENQTLKQSLRKHYTGEAEKKIHTEVNDSLNRANIYRIADNYYALYELLKFKQKAFLLKNKALKANDEWQLGNAYMFIGTYYQEISLNDSSFFYFIKAEKIFQKNINIKEIADISYRKALTQYYCNDYLGSEASLIKALRISKKEGFYDLQIKLCMLMAANSCELKNYKEALYYNNLAVQVHAGNNLKSYVRSNIYSYAGFIYLKMGNYEEARKKFEFALLEKNLIVKDPQLYSYAIDNLAYAKFKLKDYSALPQLYFRAAKIRDSLQINQGQNYNRLYLSEYYEAIKDTVKASYYARQAYKLSEEYKAPNDMLQALKQLSRVEPQNSLNYSKDYIRISDSIYQLERETRNKFAKIAYETEEITQEKNIAVTQKSIFSGIALAIFVFGFLIFIIIHQKSKHKEMYFLQQQQKSNDEIYQLIHVQHQKLEEGRLIEKQRIAQDLHDGIMNKLASTRFNLHLLTKKNDDKTFDKCAPYIDGIQDIEKEIRDIAHDLNNQVFTKNNSFKNTLVSLFDEQQKIIKAKWHIEFDSEINWETFNGNIKIHIFRIFQELLQNISKHAHANNVIISASIKKEILFLEVYDDGDGFSLKAKKKGIGLQNIHTRVKECGGLTKILSEKGKGTKVIIKIPIQQEIKIV